MLLAKNTLAERIARQLGEIKFSQEELADEFKKIIHYQHKKYAGSFPGYLAETYLHLALRKIGSEYERRVVFNPIRIPSQTRNYYFERHMGHIVALSKEDNDVCSEYDEILLLDRMPVIFEVTIAKWNKPSGGHTHTQGYLYNKINSFAVDKKIKPLIEYFKKSCSYIILADGNQINSSKKTFQTFLNNNGIFVPFPFALDEFKKEAELIEKNSLR